MLRQAGDVAHVEGAGERDQVRVFLGGHRRDRVEASRQSDVRPAARMRRTVRGRQDGERRQLDQRLDVRLANTAWPARQGLIAPRNGLRIVHDPAPTAAWCLVAVASLDPSHDLAEPAGVSRRHERGVRVGAVEIPGAAAAADEACDHAEAGAALEVEGAHLRRRGSRRLKATPCGDIRALRPVARHRQDAEPRSVRRACLVEDRAVAALRLAGAVTPEISNDCIGD